MEMLLYKFKLTNAKALILVLLSNLPKTGEVFWKAQHFIPGAQNWWHLGCYLGACGGLVVLEKGLTFRKYLLQSAEEKDDNDDGSETNRHKFLIQYSGTFGCNAERLGIHGVPQQLIQKFF